VVVVRTLNPADAAEVLALHARLTGRDRHFRFFGSGPSGPDEFAARVSDDSGPGHAEVGCFLRGALIGVAHYEVLADPTEAEMGLVVDGEVRTHGVATLLLEHLVSIGRRAGVRKLVAEVLAENSHDASGDHRPRPALPGEQRRT
jgi:GNAT superfamily N-acetyltransferase